MDRPLVSVIIPAYNSGPYLADALRSVFEQDYQPIEVIVVDDGSTDETASVARSFKDILYTFQANQGPASARNTGIRLAHGDFIAFLDADDYWPENKLRTQMSHLIENPETEVVLGRIQCIGLFTEAEKSIRFEGPDNTMTNVCLGSGVFNKSVFDKVGFFDESLRFYEDHDWFLRARERQIPMIILKQITLLNRRHGNSTSRKRKKSDPTMIRILRKSLERRRSENRGHATLLRNFFDHDEGKTNRKK
ncbi:MAG: glycosyltransferase family 2 protein [Nitrospirota bacterium]|nr:glycosyltransferase family 2 protein [Nitrospirota bacterium]